MWTYEGAPVFFHQHAFDGANAEELREADVLEVMRHGERVRRP